MKNMKNRNNNNNNNKHTFACTKRKNWTDEAVKTEKTMRETEKGDKKRQNGKNSQGDSAESSRREFGSFELSSKYTPLLHLLLANTEILMAETVPAVDMVHLCLQVALRTG